MKLSWSLVLCFLAVLSTVQSEKKKGKFLFVSSTTSTSVSTTTSLMTASVTCLILSKTTAYTASCAGRKKRGAIIDADTLIPEDLEISAAKPSRDSRDLAIPELSPAESQDQAGVRDARFAWYYMTTTLTSVSTSTSTSTTNAVTISVSAVLCTPESFDYCYAK